mmetsp:Transcript_78321/g.172858  ORF Transcript_78321/g.172858 Transcript_78321/m.172858 type:complete len:329 (-) Transcript_78321:83-1069(-)
MPLVGRRNRKPSCTSLSASSAPLSTPPARSWHKWSLTVGRIPFGRLSPKEDPPTTGRSLPVRNGASRSCKHTSPPSGSRWYSASQLLAACTSKDCHVGSQIHPSCHPPSTCRPAGTPPPSPRRQSGEGRHCWVPGPDASSGQRRFRPRSILCSSCHLAYCTPESAPPKIPPWKAIHRGLAAHSPSPSAPSGQPFRRTPGDPRGHTPPGILWYRQVFPLAMKLLGSLPVQWLHHFFPPRPLPSGSSWQSSAPNVPKTGGSRCRTHHVDDERGSLWSKLQRRRKQAAAWCWSRLHWLQLLNLFWPPSLMMGMCLGVELSTPAEKPTQAEP